MVSFLGWGAGILSLAKLGGAELESDPRSSDFGKIKVGNTRLDVWTGFIQYARFLAQITANERKDVGTGEIRDINRMDTIWRMMQSKGSPIAGLFIDLLKGSNFLGDPMLEGGWDTVKREVRNRLTPLFAQDLWDAIETDGLVGGAVASPGALGVGVISYPPRDIGGGGFQFGRRDKPTQGGGFRFGRR